MIYYIMAPEGWLCVRINCEDGMIVTTDLLAKDGTTMLTGLPSTNAQTIHDLEAFVATQMPGFRLISDPNVPRID